MVIILLEFQLGKFCNENFLFSQHSNEGNGKQPRDMKDRQYHQKKEKTILASD